MLPMNAEVQDFAVENECCSRSSC